MKTALLITLLTASGCASTKWYQTQSFGHVNCDSEKIQVIEGEGTRWRRTWTATCEGKKYRCYADMGIMDVVNASNCVEFK
jgi:hypothetical protein